MAATLPQPFGAYVLLKALGQGAMGGVFLARPYNARRGLPSPIVIKRLHGELATNPTFVRRFRHEAALAVSIDSPHVAKVYDVGAVGETLYIAMEHVAGWPLSRFMEAIHRSGRHASIASILELASGVLSGLEAMHTARDELGRPLGIVHRDISPKNLMVGEDGHARLIDLGLGKSNVQDWKTRTGVVMGSIGYMPPEQVAAETVDHRADLYAFAIVIWELLTLRSYIKRGPVATMLRASMTVPFEPPSQHRPDVSPILDRVLERALKLRAEERFQSAAEFRAALAQVVPEERRGTRSMATLIDDLFAASLPERRSEISALLSLPLPEPEDGPEQERTVVFVQAPGVAPLNQEDLAPTRVAKSGDHPVTARPSAPPPAARPMGEIQTITPAADELVPPRLESRTRDDQRGVPLPLFLVSVVLAGGLAALVTAWAAGAFEEPRTEVVPAVAAPIAVPTAAPGPGAIAAPEPAAVPAAEEERAPAPAPAPPPAVETLERTKRKSRTRPEEPRRAPVPEQIAPAAPAPEVTKEQVAERIQRLLSRAGSLRSKVPEGSAEARAIDNIRVKLSMEGGVSDPAAASRRLEQLEAQLDQIAAP